MEETTHAPETNSEYIYKLYEESHIPLLVSFLAIYLFYIGISSIIKSIVPGITDKQIHTAFDVFVAAAVDASVSVELSCYQNEYSVYKH